MDEVSANVDVFELFPLLTERHAQLAGSLSGGQKQQLGSQEQFLLVASS